MESKMPFESITSAPAVLVLTTSVRLERVSFSPWISASKALRRKQRSSPSVMLCTSAPLDPRTCRGHFVDFHWRRDTGCLSPVMIPLGANPATIPMVDDLSGLLLLEASAHTTTANSLQGTFQLWNVRCWGVRRTSLINLFTVMSVETVAYGTSLSSKPTSAW